MQDSTSGDSLETRNRPLVRRGATRGDLIVLLLAWSVPVGALVSRVLDHALRVKDAGGEPYWTSTGNLSKVFVYAFVLSAALFAVAAVASSRTKADRPRGGRYLGGLLLLWLVVVAVKRDGSSLGAQQVVLSLLFLGVVVDPPTRWVFVELRRLLWIVLVTCVLYDLATGVGHEPCRIDKCGITGSLFLGYFPQENVLAIYLTLLLPTLVGMASARWQVVTFVATVFGVLATGSRSALVACAFVGIALVLHRTRGGAAIARFRAVPALALILSLYIFLTVSGASLTGRGVIYASVRRRLHGYGLVFGGGRRGLVDAYNLGETPGLAALHEHGEAGHLLNQGGVVALLLFFGLTVVFAVRRNWGDRDTMCLILMLPPVAFFTTETPWKVTSLHDVATWSLLATAGLLLGNAPSEQPGQGSPGDPSRATEPRSLARRGPPPSGLSLHDPRLEEAPRR